MPPHIPFGRYELVRRLATGGMAELFLARVKGEAGFSKTCVVKRVLPHLSRDDRFVQLFLREARLAAKLEHPHIVQVFELGKVDADYFMAMEYLPGEDLASLVDRARTMKTALPPRHALTWIRDAAAALHYAHERKGDGGEPLGIVHRDISPSNLMLTYHGHLKVLDFGIARDDGGAKYTQTGEVRGKPAYMAPEQLSQRPVDRRADVWALGICLYELVTLRRPFGGRSTPEIAHAVCGGVLPPPPSMLTPSLPAGFDALVGRALARDEAERFSSADELRRAIDVVLQGVGGPVSAEETASLLHSLFGVEAAAKKLGEETQNSTGTADLDAEGPPVDATRSDRPTRGMSQRLRLSLIGVGSLCFGALAALALAWVQRSLQDPAPVPAPVVARVTPAVDAGSARVVAAPTPPKDAGHEAAVAWVEPLVPDAGAAEVVRVAPAVATKKRPALGVVNLQGNLPLQVSHKGKVLGTLPLSNLKLPPGSYELRLYSARLGVDERVNVTVESGRAVEQKIALAKGRLNIDADPWADVFLDGSAIGQTPLSREVWQGQHQLRLVGPGGERVVSVNVKPGETKVVRQKL